MISCSGKTVEVYNMYKLLAFDLDGTFLNDEKQIPEENLRAIRYAAEKGVEIVPATGRLFCGIPKELASLPFIRYYILINGAKIYDALEERIVSSADLSKDTALSLFRRGQELGCFYDCYVDDRGYMEKDMFNSLEELVDNPAYLRFMRSIRTPVDDLSAFVSEHAETVQKVQYFFRKEDMGIRERELSVLPELYPEIQAASSISFNIEVNSRLAGKGPSLVSLCGVLGISAAEAIAFGDGLNDADMLKAAGTGIAMLNSDPGLLPYSDMITRVTNNEAGVAEMIYELI